MQATKISKDLWMITNLRNAYAQARNGEVKYQTMVKKQSHFSKG